VEGGVRIWFDTEFIEDGKTIDLISIGLVREDGTELYLESADCNKSKASQWVVDNVFPHLTGEIIRRPEIAERIREFAGNDPEFWAYYADYDWVVLCQLYGTMMQLPNGWPMFCRDLRQSLDGVPLEEVPQQGKGEHHALADARWVRDTHLWLERRSA
jgi:hypothetical protein